MRISTRLDNLPATSARTLYVSASKGRSHNDGRSPDTAIASPSRAIAMANRGLADRVLLRRGDVFDEPLGRWTRSGRSPDTPAVLGAYGSGDTRPVVRSRSTALVLTGAPPAPLRDVLVTGLHFVAAGRDPDEPGHDRAAPAATGIWVRGPGVARVTLEDCRVEQFDDDVLLDTARDVRLHRCLLLDAAPGRGADGPAHHLAAYGCAGVCADSCVFDQNDPPGAGAGAKHRHVFAPHGNDDVTIERCILARSTGAAVFIAANRSAVNGCVLVSNRLHVAVGGGSASVTDNLILGGRDRTGVDALARSPGSHAIWATAAELTIERNVIAYRRRSGSAGIVLARGHRRVSADANDGAACSARVAGNMLYACGGGIDVAGGAAWRVVELIDNDLQRLAPRQPPVDFRDAPPRTVVLRGNRYDTADGESRRDNTPRFRLGPGRLTFEEWRVRAGDTSEVVRVDYGGRIGAARLPPRFIPDARAQSGSAWRDHLSADAILARYRRAFHFSH